MNLNHPRAALLNLLATDAAAGPRFLNLLASFTTERLEAGALAEGLDLVAYLELTVDALDATREAFRPERTPEGLEVRIAARRVISRLEDWTGQILDWRRLEASGARETGGRLADAQMALSEAEARHRLHRDEISAGQVAIALRRVTELERALATWTR